MPTLYLVGGGLRRYAGHVRLRDLRGESALAWLAAAIGCLGIASALTPELSSRVDLVRGVLPPGVPAAARVATLAFGLGLVWLSRSLAARRRRAWQLAVALVVAIALAHLAKGLDVEEASASLLLLAALLRFQNRFDVPSEPMPLRPALATAFALGAAAGGTLALEARGSADRLSDVLAAAAIVLGFRALHFWVRPLSERVLQSAGERREAGELVRAHGDDSLAFFALRQDKSWFFSPSRRSFLAYRVLGGVALVSGDPIGDEAEVPELLAEFQRVCRAHGWRLALLGVREELLPLAGALGLRGIKLGNEAVVRADLFSLEGRSIRKVRQSVARLGRARYTFRVIPAADLDAHLRAQLERVSDTWRGRNCERGFSMAMDNLFREGDALFAVAEREGRVGGFLHLVPAAGGRAYSLSAMRRLPDTPNGLMEFLVVQTVGWARDHGVDEVSLNFCVFGDLIADEPATRLHAVARRGLRAADRLFQLERLIVFTRKFAPEWRPRYVCVERLTDVPRVGIAYLRAESLLTPPAPWPVRPAARV
jgi:lysyl-tRNA synthetase, class II